jgi:SAM-dependent methyltransferase
MRSIDWEALARLRVAFLDGTAGARDYWRRESDLESYDQTFAQRIGWKWDYVLKELKRRGWSPPRGEVLDWGCGSGIAGRKFLEYFSATGLVLWDRSALARRFAASRAGAIDVREGKTGTTLLLSHVLTELTRRDGEGLLELATGFEAIIWVEPGAHEVSRALIAARERLREKFHVVAPCTHSAVCGMLAAANDRHWCHHFVPSPPAIFRDADWTRFAKFTGVDLRSLPVSFLVLDRRAPKTLPAEATRVIGRPRLYKAHALMLGCDASGVRGRRLSKRTLPEDFRRLRKGAVDPLQIWQLAGNEIITARPLERTNP